MAHAPIYVGPLPVNSIAVELIVRTLDAADLKLAALLRISCEGNTVVLDGQHARRVCRYILPEHLSRWPTNTRIDPKLELQDSLKTSALGRPVDVSDK